MSHAHAAPLPRLSDRQVQFFNTFGYLQLRRIFSPDEVLALRAEQEHAIAAFPPEVPWDGTRTQSTNVMEPSTPLFASLLEDPRFLVPAQQLCGEDVLGIDIGAARYVGDTCWHTDSADPHQSGLKFAIYLSPLRAETGALRVIPGSHRLFPFAKDFADGIHGGALDEVPATVLDSDPGDAVVFDLRIWHASRGGGSDRRMAAVCYYSNPSTPEQEAAVHERGRLNAEWTRYNSRHGRTYCYSRAWIDQSRRHPVRSRWIARLEELGYFCPGIVEGTEAVGAVAD